MQNSGSSPYNVTMKVINTRPFCSGYLTRLLSLFHLISHYNTMCTFDDKMNVMGNKSKGSNLGKIFISGYMIKDQFVQFKAPETKLGQDWNASVGTVGGSAIAEGSSI